MTNFIKKMDNLEKIKNLKKVKTFDIDKYDGVVTKIANVELLEVEEKTFGDDKVLTQQILIETENIGTEEMPVVVKNWINLKFDKNTEEFGIPDSPKSEAMKFLRFFEVDDLTQLVGVKCQVVKKLKDDGSFTLTINRG